MPLTQNDILHPLQIEFAGLPKHYDFSVLERTKEGPAWKIKVDLSRSRHASLDESLEGSRAWWPGAPGEPNGSADVLSVIPEDECINLRYATEEPPGPGELLRIFPPLYLESLIQYWRDDENARISLDWLKSVLEENRFAESDAPLNQFFPWLRARQTEAFKLPGWNLGFLWGPPGTGKTTCLGRLIASYLVQFPQKRVVLFSTTNSAVDLALVSVDDALKEMGSKADSARARCFRLGNHFSAGHYVDREHLLPTSRPDLIARLHVLESNKPDSQNNVAYAAWKQQVDAVRSEMRKHSKDVLEKSRLVALTTARGAFTIDDLRFHARFDLMVFDEASQVSIAHALTLAPLARHCFFAGDPKQLAPVAREKDVRVQKYLGNSMFEFMEEDAPHTCQLDEQSRLLPAICDLVATLFYRNRLKVAGDKINDFVWQTERALFHAPARWRNELHLLSIKTDGIWSANYHGMIRYESAEKICEIVEDLTTGEPAKDILVLTPFRAQRSLIRAMLRAKRVKSVTVSTVHRAQGSERHTIIFDPVDGGGEFLQTEDAKRLINVAISRAQARLILLISPGDRKNLVLCNLAALMERARPAHQTATPTAAMDAFVTTSTAPIAHTSPRSVPTAQGIPIRVLSHDNNFPASAVGKIVCIKGVVGQIISCTRNGSQFALRDHVTGERRLYKTAHVRRLQD